MPAVLAVRHVVRFAPGRGLVAAAGELAVLIPQGDQAAEVDGDVVGLADVQDGSGAAPSAGAAPDLVSVVP